MIHHYITKYIENEKMYVEAWMPAPDPYKGDF